MCLTIIIWKQKCAYNFRSTRTILCSFPLLHVEPFTFQWFVVLNLCKDLSFASCSFAQSLFFGSPYFDALFVRVRILAFWVKLNAVCLPEIHMITLLWPIMCMCAALFIRYFVLFDCMYFVHAQAFGDVCFSFFLFFFFSSIFAEIWMHMWCMRRT